MFRTAWLFVVVIAVTAVLYWVMRHHPMEAFGVTLVEDAVQQSVTYISRFDYDSGLEECATQSHGKIIINKGKDALSYDDILGAATIRGVRIIAVTDDEKHVCFLRKVNSGNDRRFTYLANQSNKIGYFSDKDVLVTRKIGHCYGIDFKDSQFVRLESYQQAANMMESPSSAITSVCLVANHKSPDFMNAFKDVPLSLYSFDDADSNLLRFLLPYGIQKNYNFGNIFSKYLDRSGTVRTTIALRNVIYCTKAHKFNYLWDVIIRTFKHNFEYVNYLGQTLDVHPRTQAIYRRMNDNALKKTAHNQSAVLEQYIDFGDVQNRVPGFHTTDDTMVMDGHTVNNTPLKIGDTLLLTQQLRSDHNGNYRVDKQDAKGNAMLKRIDPVLVHDPLDPRYICFTDRNIKIKELCESTRDTTGNPKRGGGKADVWDKPCVRDTECPFYQKNTNYKNYRGGCNNGYCELPLGVKQVAFRFFEGEPFCHGCPVENPSCCDTQKSPDYAFSLDEYERLPKTVEQFSSDYLIGEHDNKCTEKQVYHYEMSNGQAATTIVGPLIGKKIVPEQEPTNIPLMVEGLLPKDYHCYDSVLDTKEVHQDGKSVEYGWSTTLYKAGKSHGKRVRLMLHQNITTGDFTIVDANILGFVPQGDIVVYKRDEIQGASPINAHAQQAWKQAECPKMTQQDAAKYLCDRADKLKQEYNLDASC